MKINRLFVQDGKGPAKVLRKPGGRCGKLGTMLSACDSTHTIIGILCVRKHAFIQKVPSQVAWSV